MRNITFDEIMDFYPEHNRSVFEDLKSDCRNKYLIPFVGAGLSAFCGYLGWPDVLRQLVKFVFSADKQEDINTMIEKGELLQAAQKIHDNLPRMLIELKKIIDYRKIRDCDAQRLYASAVYVLPYLFNDSMVMTTNFDRVLEEVYDKQQKKFEKVISPYEPDLLTQIRQRNLHCLFKLHGDIGENTIAADKLVFTKEQYDRVYMKDGTLVRELTEWFRSKKLLFLGCSLAMDRTMEVLRMVSSQNTALDHYAILACKPEDMEQRIQELGELGISAIYYPDGKHDAVRVILERILEETNYTAYERLKREDATLVSESERRFMYNSDFIAFTGRQKEISLLEEFCKSEGITSWWAVIGPGGMGKSRLIHEFEKQKKAQGWKTYWLKREDYQNIINWIPGPDPSLVIADDVQAYLLSVGEWINTVAERPRSRKLRIILLERDGADLNSASWGVALQEESPYNSPVLDTCYRPGFLQLEPLPEDELKKIMTDFAVASGRPLKGDDHAARLLRTLKKVDSGLQRPIYALAIVDAWCNHKDPTCWDKEMVLEALVDREMNFYYKRLKNMSSQKISKTMKAEFESVLAKSCLSGFITLAQIPEQEYPKLCRFAESAGMDFYELIRQIGVVNNLTIQLVEIDENGNEIGNEHKESVEAVILRCPDLIKEYLVLQQAFERGHQELLFPEDWENSPMQLSFLARILRDYPEKLDGETQFWDTFYSGEPQKNLSAKLYGNVLLVITIQLPQKSSKAIEKLGDLQSRFHTNEEIALTYAKALFNYSVEQSQESAGLSVEKLHALYLQFCDNEDIAVQYAKGTFNLASNQAAEEREHSVQILKELHEKFKESEEIAVCYARELAKLTDNQSQNVRTDSVAKLAVLYTQFDSNEDIANCYAYGLSNSMSGQSKQERTCKLQGIEALFEKFKGSKESGSYIASIYANALLETAFEQDHQERMHTIDRLEQIFNQFRNQKDFAVVYATGLANLTFRQTLEECIQTMEKLEMLCAEFSDDENVAAAYAHGFPNLSLKQETEADVTETLEKARRMANLYPNVQDILLCYAMTYFNLTLKQDTEAMAQTIAEIGEYLKEHVEINQDFQKELDAYLTKHPDHAQRYQQLKV